MESVPFTSYGFEHFLHEGKLMGSRCQSCGKMYLPPHALCPACFSESMEWVEMPTTGKLATFTSIYVGQTRMAAEGYDRAHPYCVGVVELENGLRLSARILGVDAARPETIPPGARLAIVFPEKSDTDQRVELAFKWTGEKG